MKKEEKNDIITYQRMVMIMINNDINKSNPMFVSIIIIIDNQFKLETTTKMDTIFYIVHSFIHIYLNQSLIEKNIQNGIHSFFQSFPLASLPNKVFFHHITPIYQQKTKNRSILNASFNVK